MLASTAVLVQVPALLVLLPLNNLHKVHGKVVRSRCSLQKLRRFFMPTSKVQNKQKAPAEKTTGAEYLQL
jgi:hypothetical protein